MTHQSPTEHEGNARKKDRMFFLIVITLYGICFLGFLALLKPLGLINKNIAAQTTNTALAQQTNAAATVTARAEEQSDYEYVERFYNSTGLWYIGDYDKKHDVAKLSIRQGAYIWEISDTMGHTLSTDFYQRGITSNFDIYMDIKFVKLPETGPICSGFFFRRPSYYWESGAYVFEICPNNRYKVLFYNEDGWENIANTRFDAPIITPEWNRIEVNAYDDKFVFVVNNTEVFSMTDDRLKRGSLGIFVEMDSDTPGEIWFDNFGFQRLK